jgi:hypothetical protein
MMGYWLEGNCESERAEKGMSRYFRNSNKIIIKWKSGGTIMPCAWKKNGKESAWRDVISAVDLSKS